MEERQVKEVVAREERIANALVAMLRAMLRAANYSDLKQVWIIEDAKVTTEALAAIVETPNE